MIYPSADTLEKWGSKYSLVVLAAKRAKQLKSGAPPLINTTSRNPLTIALEEIAAGKVQCQVADHDILPKTTGEAEVAQLLAIPTLSLDEEGAETEGTTAVLTDDTDLLLEEEEQEEDEEEEEEAPLLTDEEEEEEHESPFVPDADDEVEEDEPVDEDEEPIEEDINPSVIPAEEPKPKARRGRKPKAEAIPEVLPEEPDTDDMGGDESEE